MGRQDWRTPLEVFLTLNELWGPFKLDVAASKENTLCASFYTKEDDGLVRPWLRNNFCNPPWEKFGAWLRRALEEAMAGRKTVLLGPAGCSQKWFQRFLDASSVSRMVLCPSQRIQYLTPEGEQTKGVRQDTHIYVLNGHTFWSDIKIRSITL